LPAINIYNGVNNHVHLKRWITGLSALPFLIFLVYIGGFPFIILVGFACICSLWEYYRIVFNADGEILYGVVVWWGYFVGLAIIVAAHIADSGSVLVVLALNLIIVGLMSMFLYKSNPSIVNVIPKQVQGIVYIPLLLSFLVSIRRDPDGMTWIFLLLAIIFAGDISAYYVGSNLGRHKLNPAISPGKTIEGAVGGLGGNLLVGSIGKFFFLPMLSWGPAVLFFLAVGIAGQVGDLFESEFKRSSKIKDSGGILPGHGGFLDRIDALLFASPVAYLFKIYIL
jgi:phosphatidate cytidylyltransferase